MNRSSFLIVIILSLFFKLEGQNVHFVHNSFDSGEGSLRYILSTSNPNDTIKFVQGLTQVILTTDELVVAKSISIIGDNNITIMRDTIGAIEDFRIFRISCDVQAVIYLKNLTIRNGKSKDGDASSNFAGRDGGGIYISSNNTELLIENCNIIHNIAGKGITASNGDGKAGGYGGGIYGSNQLIHIVSSNISFNKAGRGGNGSGTYGYGGYGGNGGGIYCNNLKIINSIIDSNVAGNGGSEGSTSPNSIGGPGGNGGGIFSNNAIIINCQLANNESGYGGGGYTGGAGGNGGGIFVKNNANFKIINTSICFNVAKDAGNQNIPGSGGGIYEEYNTHIEIENSIISDNIAEMYGNDLFGSYIVNYSLIQDVNYSTLNGDNNIVEVDPEFNSPPIDLTLSESSPAINQGNPDTIGFQLPYYDLLNNLRIVGDTIDMGAYEFQIPVNVEQKDSDKLLKIYPNPVNNYLKIENAINSELRLYSTSGKIHNKSFLDSNYSRISFSYLPKGIYIIEISNKRGRLIRKVIKH